MSRTKTPPHASMKLVLSACGMSKVLIPVSSFGEAAQQFGSWRDKECLGCSEMRKESGEIRSATGAVLARVSYNGRVWSPDGELIHDIEGGFHVRPGFRNTEVAS